MIIQFRRLTHSCIFCLERKTFDSNIIIYVHFIKTNFIISWFNSALFNYFNISLLFNTIPFHYFIVVQCYLIYLFHCCSVLSHLFISLLFSIISFHYFVVVQCYLISLFRCCSVLSYFIISLLFSIISLIISLLFSIISFHYFVVVQCYLISLIMLVHIHGTSKIELVSTRNYWIHRFAKVNVNKVNMCYRYSVPASCSFQCTLSLYWQCVILHSLGLIGWPKRSKESV